MKNYQCKVYRCRGKSQTLREWADEAGLPISFIRGRIYRGWSMERAISEPRNVFRVTRGDEAGEVPPSPPAMPLTWFDAYVALDNLVAAVNAYAERQPDESKWKAAHRQVRLDLALNRANTLLTRICMKGSDA